MTDLPEVLLITPRVFPDARGVFEESWEAVRYAEAGIAGPFVQDNLSRSIRGTLRGLHYQEPDAQGKLVTVFSGAVLDVAVDIRKGSPRFGKWVAVELNGDTLQQLWIPPGFAHGFCVLSERADFFYKCTERYSPRHQHAIRWDDPEIGITWPLEDPVLSERDARAPTLASAPVLPEFPGGGA